MLPRSAGYALLALAYLAAQPSGKLAGAREIATSTGIPVPFLWKILRHLRGRKLIRSFKGVHGGYELARAPNKITVVEVVMATQENNPATRCVLGLLDCDKAHPCLLHSTWKGIRERIQNALEKTTVADLVLGARVPRPAKRSRGSALRGRTRHRREDAV